MKNRKIKVVIVWILVLATIMMNYVFAATNEKNITSLEKVDMEDKGNEIKQKEMEDIENKTEQEELKDIENKTKQEEMKDIENKTKQEELQDVENKIEQEELQDIEDKIEEEKLPDIEGKEAEKQQENLEEQVREEYEENIQTDAEAYNEEFVKEIVEAENKKELEEEPVVEEISLDNYNEIYYDKDLFAINSFGEYTSTRQEISDALYEAISSTRQDVYLVNYGLDLQSMKTNIIEAMFECKNINRIFYGNNVSVSTYPKSQKILFKCSEGAIDEIWYYSDYTMKIVYNDVESIRRTTDEFNKVVNEILELCTNVTMDIDKELIIHDYLVSQYQYDHERLNNGTIPRESYSAYGLLVNKTGVCQGYAYAMKYLLRKLGIPCDVVTGGNHAWNIVSIDGENYYLDTTWDDPVPDIAGRIKRTFFNATTSQMQASNHEWDIDEYPLCDNEQYIFLQNSEEYIHDGDNWFYNKPQMEYMPELGYNVTNNLYTYNVENREEKLLVIGSCTALRYDKENQYLYYTKQAEEYGYDLLQDSMNGVYEMIKNFYRYFLRREASELEISIWAREVRRSQYTAVELAQAFLNSDEALNKGILSNEVYIDYLYQGLLNRKAQIEEIDRYSQYLNQGFTRTYILRQITQSAEFASLCNQIKLEVGEVELIHASDRYSEFTPFVNRFYQIGLNRIADQEGLNYWTSMLYEQKITAKEVAKNFFLSKEFLNLNLTNKAFIEKIYNTCLNRDGDLEGINYWQHYLLKGSTREEVIGIFLNSEEFEKKWSIVI